MPQEFLQRTPQQLTSALAARGEKAFRAKQLLNWVYGKGVTDTSAMTNLPDRLAGEFTILTSEVAERHDSRDGTTKLLLGLADGETVETVLIPSGKRVTACLSTQVGCAMGCTFCATAEGGWRRNLSGGEILEQILHLQQQTGQRVTNVVFMGMGEPLANYDATLHAVRAIVDPERLGISARKVTISTVGLPKQIRRLAGEDLPVTLAISLHAPNDALRKTLIPGQMRAPLDAVIQAARQYYQARKREVTLEYLLIAGVNDTKVCAEALARLARQLRCNVNLIRYNPFTAASEFRPPTRAATEQFAERLQRRGVNVNLRRSRGQDTQAACGQLRRRRVQAR
ncbi:MAG: 23S rRNA (adenine(2503)-C(2))-methyltransferase RlmN [Planctomycetota bacterium]